MFALDQRLVVSSAALLTSHILVSRETLLQAPLLPLALSAATLSMALVQVSSGVSSMPPGVVPGPVDSASAPPSSGRSNYLPTQSQASYHSTSSSPLAHHPYSGFDVDTEEADVRANVAVTDADIRASAVMTVDYDDDADDGIYDNTLSEIHGASSRVAPSLDLDLAFGTVDSNVDPACTPLPSPLSPLPTPLVSPPPSAAAGEPI